MRHGNGKLTDSTGKLIQRDPNKTLCSDVTLIDSYDFSFHIIYSNNVGVWEGEWIRDFKSGRGTHRYENAITELANWNMGRRDDNEAVFK